MAFLFDGQWWLRGKGASGLCTPCLCTLKLMSTGPGTRSMYLLTAAQTNQPTCLCTMAQMQLTLCLTSPVWLLLTEGLARASQYTAECFQSGNSGCRKELDMVRFVLQPNHSMSLSQSTSHLFRIREQPGRWAGAGCKSAESWARSQGNIPSTCPPAEWCYTSA